MAGERWIFTKSQLLSTPSRKAGLDSDKELSYRQQAANLIQDMGQRLQVTQLCINTAIVYMHRFYMFHSFQRFHRNSISPACLFLAAKVEEQSRKLEHVIKVAHLCLHREAAALDTKSDDYLEKAHDLVINENILLQTLGFDITVDHPHTHVVKTSQLVRASKDLAQTSYFLATNSLHLTTMCLQYRPTVVACVCIHLACKWSNWEIPTSSEGKDWFWYVDKNVKLELLEDLTQDFLNILDRCPSRLKRKIMTWKSTREKDDDKDGPSEKRARMLEASASSTADTPGSSSPGSQNIASFVRTKAEFLLQTSGQKSGERSPVSFSSFKLHEQLTGGHGSKKPTSHKADSHGHSLGSTVHSLEKKSQFKTGSHSMIRTDPDKKPEKGTHTIHKYNSPLKLTITKEPSVDSRDLQTKDGRKSSIALSQSKQGSSHEINTQASQEYMRQKLFSPVKSSKLDITKLTGQSSSFQQHHGTNVKPAKHSIHGNSHHSQASTSSKASFSNPTNVFSSLEHTELVAQPTKHKQPASPVVNELMSPQKNLAKMPRMIELATGQHFSADVINQIASTVDFSTDVGQELQNPFLLESELALKSLEANGSGTSPQVPSGSTAGREKFDQLQLQLQQLIDLQKSHIAHLQQQQQELTQQHDIFLSDSSLPPFPPIPQELPPLPPMPPSSPPPQPKF